MDLASFRLGRGLSQQQCAEELGLSSKSYVSGLESGAVTAPLRLALRVEQWSAGQVTADSLVTDEDRELLATHRRLAAEAPGSRPQPAEARV